MINTSNLNQARKEIHKLKKENKQIIVKAQDNEFNRKIIEIKDVDVLISPEINNRKDSLKQRDSGLNEVLCKIASKNNIAIGIDLNEIKRKPKKEKAVILSRIMQNIRLCKKTKTRILLFPKQKKQDILGFFVSLKASTEQAKKAC